MTAVPPASASLSDWLAYLETRNREPIVLGLDRVRAVRAALGLDPAFPIVTVGGTNGKGSTCAYLEAILLAAGYRTGCYTSPHLLRFNERIRVGGAEATDVDIVDALARVEALRRDIPLTYFEQGTLAAMLLFQRAGVDVSVLEVGLGGRLDAVNVWDADCALVTSVDLDHQQFLATTGKASASRRRASSARAGPPFAATSSLPKACSSTPGIWTCPCGGWAGTSALKSRKATGPAGWPTPRFLPCPGPPWPAPTSTATPPAPWRHCTACASACR